MQTLKSVDQQEELLKHWNKIPPTKHPLTDGTKWALDVWVLDEWNGSEAVVMLAIQGEFQERECNIEPSGAGQCQIFPGTSG